MYSSYKTRALRDRPQKNTEDFEDLVGKSEKGMFGIEGIVSRAPGRY